MAAVGLAAVAVAAGARLRRLGELGRRQGQRSGPRARRRSKSSPPATAPARSATPPWSRSRWRTSSLAPRQFGGEPQLGEGNLRFSLKRVPDCVDPKKLADAIKSPVGKGRLVGESFDYARYAGPNGVLAEQIGSAGGYSPATRPEIYYHGLVPASTAWSSTSPRTAASPTQFHDVTNFQILPRPGHGPKPCSEGKVPSAKAAARFGIEAVSTLSAREQVDIDQYFTLYSG